MSISKIEKKSIIGIALAAAVVLASLGTLHMVQVVRENHLQEAMDDLNVTVGMGEAMRLDSAADNELLEDGVEYSAGLPWEGVASFTVKSVVVYDSKEDMEALFGDFPWLKERLQPDAKGYAVCTLLVDNESANPLLSAEDGTPLFDSSIVRFGSNNLVAIDPSYNRSNPHEALKFHVAKGESLSLKIVYALDKGIDTSNLRLWYGTDGALATAHHRYSVKLDVSDYRG